MHVASRMLDANLAWLCVAGGMLLLVWLDCWNEPPTPALKATSNWPITAGHHSLAYLQLATLIETLTKLSASLSPWQHLLLAWTQ